MSKRATKTDFIKDDDEVTPVIFSTSKAAVYKASENYRQEDTNKPPSQWYVVTFSTAFFLIYFIVLREENDIDERLYQPWAGNEKIYKNILEVHLKKSTGSSSEDEIKAKIKELEDKIGKQSSGWC